MKKNISILIVTLILFFLGNNLQAQTDSLKIYTLGEVVVSGKTENYKQTVSQEITQQLNLTDVASAINTLPSVQFVNVGGRNEGAVYVRGFDTRSVPVFADGIPVYVPYDGYVDLSRFSVADLSKIEVSKGYTSILYGANTIGGSINLVSSKPSKKIEANFKAGVMSGNGYLSNLNVGSKLGKFYVQGNFAWYEKEFVQLSQNFDTSSYQPDFELDNSFRLDQKASLKVGFTPNKTDEYSLNYIYQHGEKGNPVYLGSDENARPRYWQWPNWDKQSLYLISKTSVGKKNYIKTRLFYDQFYNKLQGFDDATYSTQTARYAFTSYYDDFSYGGSLEAGTELIKNNLLKFALHFKNDTHRENNEDEPQRTTADNIFSVGIEDEITIFEKFKLVPGASYNFRNSVVAEDYTNNEISKLPENQNDALNLQIATSWEISKKVRINLNTANKTRFPTMKDRYSYKLGRAIPNPDLQPETAWNNELASDIKIYKNLIFQPAIFYSRLENTIQNVDDVEPGISQMQNTGKSQFYGADFNMSWEIFKNFALSANYTYIQRENLSNPDLKFIDVPDHAVFAYADYSPFKNFNFVLSSQYNSDRFSTSDGIIAQEFTVFNSQISYKFLKYMKAEVGVNNILDKNYAYSEGYPNEGRNYYFSVIFNLN